MKNLLLIIIIAITGCANHGTVKLDKYKFIVFVETGRRWHDKNFTSIYCDSLNMVGVYEAVLWIDGTRTVVKSDNPISFKTNGAGF